MKVLRKIIQIDEERCNGCGECISSCAEGALALVDGKARLVKEKYCDGLAACLKECPQKALKIIEREAEAFDEEETKVHLQKSFLTNWPVQLTLVSPGAKFLNNADAVLVADCVPFCYPDFHQDFLKDHSVMIACPKLDDAEAHLAKLTEVIKRSNLKSLTVVRMEVPCCSGLTNIARKAISSNGLNLPFKEVVIGIKGEIKTQN
jgi:NAD-dependent dihydropyrimidine dehydrogenase PreA subunit